jgi:hypothetical protein
MFAELHRRNRGNRMSVVRRADDHGVERLLGFKHLPEIAITLRIGIFGK